jgi:hypothetical protein
MSDKPPSVGSSYSEGVKWTIGLSGAAVAAVFLHLGEIGKQSTYARWLIAIAVGLFAISIMCGVNYLHWLMADDTDRDRQKEIKEELSALDQGENREDAEDTDNQNSKDNQEDDRRALLKKRLVKHRKRSDKSYRVKPRWHVAYLVSFLLAAMLSSIVLFIAVVQAHAPQEQGKKEAECVCGKFPAAATSNRFAITYSALHQGRHGKETHTFLLDQQTGEVWQMQCTAQDKVEFQPVSVIRNSK